jgi:putative Holliday junction resolvase
VGLPLNMDGTEGQQATWVRDYCEELSQVVASTIVLWDERLSTAEAREILKAQGRSGDGNPVDAVAAAVILQSYLDAHAGEPHAFGKEYC